MRVFISGPLGSGSAQHFDIRNVLEVANIVSELGHSPFVGHLYQYWDDMFPNMINYGEWSRIIMDWLEVSDAIIRIPGVSEKADNEVSRAKALNIPVYYGIEKFKIAMDPDAISIQELAEQLHSMECHANHTDACSWHYGSWENPSYAHTKYYKKAEQLRANVQAENVPISVFVSILKKHNGVDK